MRILGIYGELDKLTHKGQFRSSTSSALVAEDGSKAIYVRDLFLAKMPKHAIITRQ